MSSYAGKTFALFHHEKILSCHHPYVGMKELTPSDNAYIGPLSGLSFTHLLIKEIPHQRFFLLVLAFRDGWQSL
jgi:hypothetical protein